MPTTPAPTELPDFADLRRSVTYLPLLIDEARAEPQFWLVTVVTEWTEDGRPHIRRELWLRCAHCDYGHNGHNNATVRDLTRMGELAEGHTGACRRGGRTFRLDSSDAVRAAALSDQAEQVVRLASPLEAAHDA